MIRFLGFPFKAGISRPDRDNVIDRYISEDDRDEVLDNWEKYFSISLNPLQRRKRGIS